MPRMSVGVGPFRFYAGRSVHAQARRNVAIRQEMRRIEAGAPSRGVANGSWLHAILFAMLFPYILVFWIGRLAFLGARYLVVKVRNR